MIVAMNVPMPRVTASLTTSPFSVTAGLRMMFSWLRSMSPKIQPMNGMNTSLTRDVVILPNAPPTMTPTAMSSTLPRVMKSRNSFAIFFIFLPPMYFSIIYPASGPPCRPCTAAGMPEWLLCRPPAGGFPGKR